ncbi:MAG TPA: ABC transporter permease, partial [Casimicrobiaceae bacterium]|nr:ABC transporter permease [Casimicrobiaceae bacterium]
MRRLLRRPSAAIGFIVIASFVIIALGAAFIAPYDPVATSFSTVRKAPSIAHWFGTDEIGRDVLSRVVYGARASLLAGVVSVLISISVGVPV